MGDTTPVVEAIQKITVGDLQTTLVYLAVFTFSIMVLAWGSVLLMMFYDGKLIEFMEWVTTND